ncbi:hypothetical protein [Streptomyces sp. NPDC050263]|uniref:hypothetical protein n=1 Tax=Streptomyces sp. NPDC050263 TaxID=3155037 RepID=UPI00341DD3BD
MPGSEGVVGGVAARCTAGDDVRLLLPAGESVTGAGADTGVEPELRAADDPVGVSAGAGRLLTG